MEQNGRSRLLNTVSNLLALSLLSALTLGGCAKKRDYDAIFKEQVQDKSSAIDEASEYLYVPSMVEAPRSVNSTRPGAQGTERLVKFKFTETSLVAEAVELDGRFGENPTNQKPVLSIPVQHMDFRCADNGAGECSNKEELIDDRSWKEKRYFKTNIDGMAVQETNTLPLDLDNLFQPCQTEIGSRVVRSEMNRESVNIVVEKTYRANLECVGDSVRDLEDLPDALTFNVRYHYSFVKRDSVIFKDYVIARYPALDENTFGFFKTETKTLSVDNREEEKGKLTLMSRWNPARKTIPYELNSAFAKPENRAVLEATKEAVGAVNAALAQSGAGFQIDLKAPSDVLVGDARKSMIMMVEDPQASGVIGYGPSVKDPRTGEIVSARVIMYYGTMKKFIRGTWEDFVAEELAKAEADENSKKASASSEVGVAETMLTKLKGAVNRLLRLGSESVRVDDGERHAANGEPLDEVFKSYEEHKAAYVPSSRTNRDKPVLNLGLSKELLTQKGFRKFEKAMLRTKDDSLLEARSLRNFGDEENAKKSNFFRKRTELLAKVAYPADYLNVKGAVEFTSLTGLKEVPRKPWSELSETEQEKVVSVVLPFVWVPTLIHELGHNLGLRHNFAGSEDDVNFYSEEEGKQLGHAHEMKYSSVMDYGYTEMNSLRIMGKYDVAALRYAYRGEVATKDGGSISVADSLDSMNKLTGGRLAEQIVDFKYCTDENVGINPNCRRFDEGTSFESIAKHLLTAYDATYWRLNFRNGKTNFSEMNDGAYLGRIDDTLSEMRPFFESYDRMWNLFGGDPEKDPDFKGEGAESFRKYYLDLKAAVLVSRDAILKPVLMPEAGCWIVFVKGKSEGHQIPVTMKQLGGTVKSCFDPFIVNRLAGAGAVPLAQFGRSFQNRKSPDSANPYADQIDTRGIWGDKLLAVNYLVKRRMGVKSWDDYRGNFLDSTTFQDPVMDAKSGKQKVGSDGKPVFAEKGFDVQMTRIIDSYLLNDVKAPLDLVGSDGKVVATLPRFNFFPHAEHWIPFQRSRGIRNVFGLPTDDVPFAEAMLSTVLKEMEDTTPNASARAIREYYGLKTVLDLTDVVSEYSSYDLGDLKVFAHRSKNTFGLNLISQIGYLRVLAPLSVSLEKLDDAAKVKRIAAILAAAGGGSGEGLTAEEAAVAKIPVKLIELYRDGKLDDQAYYELVLRMMARANLRAGLTR